MGSSASKARTATKSAATRKYPSAASRPIPSSPAPPPAPVGPTVHPPPQASETRTESVNLDASDPDFARSLRSLGAVQPNPTQSPSSVFSSVLENKAGRNPATTAQQQPPATFPPAAMNPALLVLQAREKWQALADKEAEGEGGRDFTGRTLLDVGYIRRALELRDKGLSDAEIEKRLQLGKGTAALLGKKGLVNITTTGGDWMV